MLNGPRTADRPGGRARIGWRLGLLAVFLVGLAHGLWWTHHKSERYYTGQDSSEYRLLAHNLLDGRGYSRDTQPPFAPTLYREPGYPVFLAGVFALTGRSDQAVAGVQSALLGLSAVLATILARDLFADRRVALLGGAWTALLPDLGDHARYEMSEALFVPALLLTALLAFRAWRASSVGGHALAGLAFALASYVRVMALPTAALLQGLLLLVFRAQARPILARSLVLGAVLLISIAPWMARNGLELHRFSFTGRSGAFVLPRGDKAAAPPDRQLTFVGLAAWVATYPLSELVVPVSRLYKPPYIWDGPLGDFEQMDSERSLNRHCAGVDSPVPGDAINATDACHLEVGLRQIATHPLQYLYLTPVEWVRLTFYTFPSKLSLIRGWTVWLGLAGALVGLRAGRSSPERIWLLLFILAYTLPSVAGDTLDRYGVPLLPFYALFAAAGAVGAADALARRRGFRRARPAATTTQP